jgi:hypothetical protein
MGGKVIQMYPSQNPGLNPQDCCPPDDYYCPFCGTKLIDAEVEEPTHAITELSCSFCGTVTTLIDRLVEVLGPEKRCALAVERSKVGANPAGYRADKYNSIDVRMIPKALRRAAAKGGKI